MGVASLQPCHSCAAHAYFSAGVLQCVAACCNTQMGAQAEALSLEPPRAIGVGLPRLEYWPHGLCVVETLFLALLLKSHTPSFEIGLQFNVRSQIGHLLKLSDPRAI